MLYIHIPFCKQACHYCDFHFSTSLQNTSAMVDAIVQEIRLRKTYLQDNVLESIYFGGGTPSVLSPSDIQRILDEIANHFHINQHAEITLEANPDDLNPETVFALRHTAINRFSIGVQSFFEEDLQWMNRAHRANEADQAIRRVQDAGFTNITCDLIYGYPLLTDAKWLANMEQMVGYGIPHISSYAMTVEDRTALNHQIHQGKTPPMNELQSARQMQQLMQFLQDAGYTHYEISNFARPDHYARHNTNYWNGKHYLGVGPSAHSFNGVSRSWNVANNAKYLRGVSTEKLDFGSENLTVEDQINEYIMTRIRTIWGLSLAIMEERFGLPVANQVLSDAQIYLHSGDLILKSNTLYLSNKGKILADRIASDLFFILPA